MSRMENYEIGEVYRESFYEALKTRINNSNSILIAPSNLIFILEVI